ncbi:MAG: hypothetical protein LRY55_07300, partial [Leadbetterella sp.]|nr:hypothetical protein [Leadbetterella sp.]
SYRGSTRIEFSKLAQDKITSINAEGDLEIILPADTKANLKMNSTRGNVYTDFDLKKAEIKEKNDGWEEVVATGYYAGSPTRVRSTGLNTYTIEGDVITSQMDAKAVQKVALASVAAAQKSRGRYDYTVNNGGVYMSITSYSGNVYLKKK